MNYKKGDIVIVKFPFILNQRTEKQKGRPALIISVNGNAIMYQKWE